MKKIENEKGNYQKVPTRALIDDDVPEKSAPFGYGYRHLQAALLLLNLTIAYTNRAHLSLTLVAMSTHKGDARGVNITNIVLNNSMFTNTTVDKDINATLIAMSTHKAEADDVNITNSVLNDSIFINATVDEDKLGLNEMNSNNSERNKTNSIVKQENETSNNTWDVYRTYEWSKPIQEMILDSFFLGYFLMMFPMGMICQRFGGKIPLQISLAVNGVVTVLTPTVAVWGGWKAVCICRVLQGLSQAGIYPSTHTVLSKWVPVSERAMFSSYIYTGSTLGTVIAFQSAGALASSKAGWPATFWVLGSVSLGAFILITIFAASSPTEHKSISEEEKNLILEKKDDGVKKALNIPWKQILSSKHVWGAFVSHVASGVSFVFLFTQIPSYMFYMLGFNIKDSGILSSLPYIANIFFSIAYGYASEYCTNNGVCTLKTARIVSNSVAQVGPALCLLAVSFTENSTFAVILLVFGVGLISGVHTGWMVNYIDLSPNFSGSLMAFGNTITAFGSLAQPVLISNIVTDVKNRSQWRIMMSLMACIMFVSNAAFCWFMSAEKQPWDQVDDQGTSNEEETKELKTL